MSPFAMTLTQAFERRLLSNAAGSLLTAYREKGRLHQLDAKIASIADHAPRDTPVDRSRRERETRRLIELKLRGDPTAPNLILKPRLTLTIVGVTHAIELDYLVAGDADPFYRVGVIKSYADRGGKTTKPTSARPAGKRPWVHWRSSNCSFRLDAAESDLFRLGMNIGVVDQGRHESRQLAGDPVRQRSGAAAFPVAVPGKHH